MQDEAIIELYFSRNENAIRETESKYGAYCMKVACNILSNHLDSEECVNDTWLKTWNSIPPQRPKIFKSFLAKITRNLAINRLNFENAEKRASSNVVAAIDELSECISGKDSVENEFQSRQLEKAVNAFVGSLPERERKVFLRRYFFADSTEAISEMLGISNANVLTILSRTRKKLKAHLEKEGLNDE